MGISLGDEERSEFRRDLVRAVVGRATPGVEATPTLGVVPNQPLVADAPTDAVARAEFTHGEAIAEGVAHEALTFGHDSTFFPEHRWRGRIEGRRAR
jgi:hypothetical protein